MIVAKFGGSVLDGAEGIRRACNEIAGLPAPLVVVVSAFADATNKLEQLADVAVAEPQQAERLLENILEQYQSIARDLFSQQAFTEWEERTRPYGVRLAQIISGLGIVRELSSRTLDLVVHFGERYSSATVAAALRQHCSNTTIGEVSALDLIITDSAHRYARPDITLTRERISEKLQPAFSVFPIVVTEGYIARSVSGEVTTMGRESSDYSATLLGQMLRADEVRIYTGVPGVLTADPKVVSSAVTIPAMGYGMANTLAELGAKVLHPRTVEPMRRSGIPLVITTIGGLRTVIGNEHAKDADSHQFSIALLPGAGIITLITQTTDVDLEPFAAAVAADAPIVWRNRFRHRAQIVTALPYPDKQLPIRRITERVEVDVRPCSIVSLVCMSALNGYDMERFFSVLGEHSPLAVQGGIDEHSVSVVLDFAIAVGVARKLHDVFGQTMEEKRSEAVTGNSAGGTIA